MKWFHKDWILDPGRVQIELKSNSAKPMQEHRHDFIELVYTLDGCAVHVIDDKEYRASHGSLLFIDYGQVHSVYPDKQVSYMNVLMEPEFFSSELVNAESIADIFRYSMFSDFSENENRSTQCVLFQNEERERIDNLIYMMFEEYAQKAEGYLSALKAQAQILFVYLLRKMNRDADMVVNSSMQEVMDYINEHFHEKIELNDIAARGFYNPDYLSKLLKKHCGKSFSQYVKEKRIAEAAKLIRTTDLSVSEIMKMSGYGDSKIFYKHFKELYDVAPGSYRAQKLK